MEQMWLNVTTVSTANLCWGGSCAGHWERDLNQIAPYLVGGHGWHVVKSGQSNPQTWYKTSSSQFDELFEGIKITSQSVTKERVFRVKMVCSIKKEVEGCHSWQRNSMCKATHELWRIQGLRTANWRTKPERWTGARLRSTRNRVMFGFNP